eukprot:1588064-Amphidinium_carterae.1
MLSRQTCDAEVDANGTSVEKSKIRIEASWQIEGLQVVDCSVRYDLSVVSRRKHPALNGLSRAHSMVRGSTPWQALKLAVPGFLQVSDFWRWVLSNAVAIFSGLTVCEQ